MQLLYAVLQVFNSLVNRSLWQVVTDQLQTSLSLATDFSFGENLSKYTVTI